VLIHSLPANPTAAVPTVKSNHSDLIMPALKPLTPTVTVNYNDTRRYPDTDTGGRWFELSYIYYSPRGRQKASRGQARVHNQFRAQNGTGRQQAGSRSGAGRMVRQAGSESRQARVRTRRTRKNGDWEKQELGEKCWLTWQTR
jgi:hypothetical protein